MAVEVKAQRERINASAAVALLTLGGQSAPEHQTNLQDPTCTCP